MSCDILTGPSPSSFCKLSDDRINQLLLYIGREMQINEMGEGKTLLRDNLWIITVVGNKNDHSDLFIDRLMRHDLPLWLDPKNSPKYKPNPIKILSLSGKPLARAFQELCKAILELIPRRENDDPQGSVSSGDSLVKLPADPIIFKIELSYKTLKDVADLLSLLIDELHCGSLMLKNYKTIFILKYTYDDPENGKDYLKAGDHASRKFRKLLKVGQDKKHRSFMYGERSFFNGEKKPERLPSLTILTPMRLLESEEAQTWIEKGFELKLFDESNCAECKEQMVKHIPNIFRQVEENLTTGPMHMENFIENLAKRLFPTKKQPDR